MMTQDYLCEKLKSLRDNLSQDLMLSTNREQHIRATQRLQAVDNLLNELSTQTLQEVFPER